MLELMGDRLRYLHSHDAITLLRHSFAIPKMLHILRTSPCLPPLAFRTMTVSSVRSWRKSATSILGGFDTSWLQATLPINMGGLGIRSVVHLALSPFLASADGSLKLVHNILPSRLLHTIYQEREEALYHCGFGQEDVLPLPPASYRKKARDLPRLQQRLDLLLSTTTDAMSRVRCLAALTKESGAWLKALPASSLGLRMHDETIRIAIGLRLRCPLCLPHACAHCGEDVEQYATHGLSCRWSKGRHSRHGEINDIIHRSLVSTKIPSKLEPTALLRSDGKRPDCMSIIPWTSGRLLVWDATCSDTFAASNIHAAVTEVGAVAAQAEMNKISKYSHLDSSYLFVPVAIEMCGPFGPKAQKFFREVGG